MAIGREYSKKEIIDAKKLRLSGKSYNEISKITGIPKSTIGSWVRDVKLNPEKKRKLYSEKILQLNSGKYSSKERRNKELENIIKNARNEITKIEDGEFFIAGVMLYLAEGSKTQSTAITNSDPRIIKMMVEWFYQFCDLPNNSLKAHLHIHDTSKDTVSKKYWSKITGIPISNFGKSYVKKKGTGHRKNKLPHGIIRIRVSGKGGVNLRYRILSWADKIYELKFTCQ